MEKLKVAIIGFGNMGSKYARMIVLGEVKNMQLVAVSTRNEKAQKMASELDKNIIICSNEDELYAHKECFDAVIITTPHKLHPGMSIRAFSEGKAVLSDKPAGISVMEANKMSDAAKAAGKVYALMYHQRAYGKFVKVKQLLQENAIGKLIRVDWIDTTYYRTKFYHKSGAWRSSFTGEGGGVLINQGIHLLDMWQYLFGMPDEIYANVSWGKSNDFLVDDEARILMKYKDGLNGHFFVSTIEAHGGSDLQISGTEGFIRVYNNTVTLTKYSENLSDYSKNATVTNAANLKETSESFEFDTANAYEKMLENFANAVLFGEELIANGDEGANSLALVNAAYLSKEKNAPIAFPINEEEYSAFLSRKMAMEENE